MLYAFMFSCFHASMLPCFHVFLGWDKGGVSGFIGGLLKGCLALGPDGGLERTGPRPCNIERGGKVVIRVPNLPEGWDAKVLAWGAHMDLPQASSKKLR